MRARVAGAYRTVNYGVRPLGALLRGGLGTAVDLRDTPWVCAAGAALSGVWLLRPAVLRLRTAAHPPAIAT